VVRPSLRAYATSGVPGSTRWWRVQGLSFLLHVQRFRGGLVFKAHRLRVSLNSRLESNKEEEGLRFGLEVQSRV